MRDWLVEHRKQHNLTQSELASKLGVSQQVVWQWESGNRTPKPATAKKIAEILLFDWTKFFES